VYSSAFSGLQSVLGQLSNRCKQLEARMHALLALQSSKSEQTQTPAVEDVSQPSLQQEKTLRRRFRRFVGHAEDVSSGRACLFAISHQPRSLIERRKASCSTLITAAKQRPPAIRTLRGFPQGRRPKCSWLTKKRSSQITAVLAMATLPPHF
jgi:hypothetical protein